MSAPVLFANVALDLPDGWCDITDNLGGAVPPTLAREEGVGSLQFSVGLYREGVAPHFTKVTLTEMLQEFCRARGLRLRGEIQVWDGRSTCVYADCEQDGDLVRIYYASNGLDVALVTYRRAASDSDVRELAEADSIVRSISFAAPA